MQALSARNNPERCAETEKTGRGCVAQQQLNNTASGEVRVTIVHDADARRPSHEQAFG